MNFHPARVAPKKTAPTSPAEVFFVGNERAIMDNEFWASMRENEFIVVDAQSRKIAVYHNDAGMIVMAVQEGNDKCFATLGANEFNAFIGAFNAAREAAEPRDAEIEASYAIHCAKEGWEE